MEEIIVFNLGKEFFGIEIKYVLEIIKKQKITPIPTEDKFLLGVINIRNKVKDVFDLEKFLEFNNKEYNNEYFLICSNEDLTKEIVFPITDVKNILKITNKDKIEIPNKEFISDNIDYIIKNNSKLITVLNFKKIIKEL